MRKWSMARTHFWSSAVYVRNTNNVYNFSCDW